MAGDFIRDGTALYDDKVDPNPVTIANQQWSAADAAFVKGALLSVQTYLRGGLFDVATLQTTDIDLINSANPAVGPEMDWGGNRGRWFIGIDVANSPTSRDFVLTGQRGTYSFSDGTTTNASPTLTSASGGAFVVALIGATISGAGIPAGTTITAVGGLTTLTMSAPATATAGGVTVTVTRSAVQDLAYWRHRGGLSATLGIGVTPPDGTARLQVSGQDDEPTMGTMRLRVGPTQTGKALVVFDSAALDQWWIDAGFYMSGSSGNGVKVQAEGSASGKAVTLADNTKVTQYSIGLPTGSGGVLRFKYETGGTNIFDLGTDGSFRHVSSKFGIFAATPAVKPTITGSRGGNAALASLLTGGATLGLWTDSTTA